MGLFRRKPKPVPEPEPKPVPTPAPEPEKPKNEYDFIAYSTDEKTDKAINKFQKFWTDDEDRYNGMTLKEFKEDGCPGDKVYQYPPLDVDVSLEAFIGEDGSVTISVFILDGADDKILVGTAAKTKAKKILRILQENDPKITGELYGGKYWKIEDSGYVNNDWSEKYTVRVYLRW